MTPETASQLAAAHDRLAAAHDRLAAAQLAAAAPKPLIGACDRLVLSSEEIAWVKKQYAAAIAARPQVEVPAETGRVLRTKRDPWTFKIFNFLRSTDDDVTVEEILKDHLGIPRGRQQQSDLNRVVGILQAEGWRKIRATRGGVRTYVYRAPEKDRADF